MPEFRETYASPGLRWGIFVEDHPGADCKFDECLGTDAGVPAEYGGDKPGVLCSIIVDGEVHKQGWKEFEGTRNPENWEKCCTKAQGRALKRAGYPSDTRDLKALVLWRQRKVELAQLQAGYAPRELSPVDAALDAAANDGEDDDEVVDGEVIDTQENSDTPSATTQREEDASQASTSSTAGPSNENPIGKIDGDRGSAQSQVERGADPQPSLDDVVGPRDALAVRIRALPDHLRALYMRDRNEHKPNKLPPLVEADDLELGILTQIVEHYERQAEDEAREKADA